MLEAFFKRAVAWEKGGGEEHEEGVHAISLSEERDGVYFYQSGQELGVLLEGHRTKIPLQQMRSIVPGLRGFNLVMIYLDKVSKSTKYSIVVSSTRLTGWRTKCFSIRQTRFIK